MAPPKNLSKVGFAAKGSFGGPNQPSMKAESKNNTGHSSAASEGISSLSSLESAKVSARVEDFPPLGKVDSSSLQSAAKPIANRQEGSKTLTGGSSHRRQTQHMPTTSEKAWRAVSGTRKLHRGAEQDEEWLSEPDEDDFTPRTSPKNKKLSSSRRQTADVSSGPGASASGDRIYFLGRLLSSILRHRATDLQLEVRDDGYVVMSNLLKLGIRTRRGIPLSAYTIEDVLKAVEQDNKQRFSVLTENGVSLIRANQGHSIKTIESGKLLKPILSSNEIPVCVHGTLGSNLDSILKTGLKKMGRNHVHFASGLPKEDGVISGMRRTSEVLIYLDSEKALQDGMKLYLSDNGVILTDGFDGVVPPEYFAKIARWEKGKAILLSHNPKPGTK